MVITVCDLIEKFECAGKFTMCENNVTRKYWLIADRPNETKKCGPFSLLVQILWGGHAPPCPPLPTPLKGSKEVVESSLPMCKCGGGYNIISTVRVQIKPI